MSKAKSRDNILVDMYNLKLLGHPEKDKAMIIEFFKKYDPNLTKYLMAKDVEGITNIGEMTGSLGYFEHTTGKSWFETEQVKDFYDLWLLIREIIDGKINHEITQWQAIRVNMLAETATSCLLMVHKETQKRISGGNMPEKIDPEKYEFIEGIRLNIETVSVNQESTNFILHLGWLKYSFFKVIQQLLQGGIEIKKCGLESCGRAFIPHKSGSEQIYCIANHRKKAFAQKKTLDIIPVS